MASNQSTLLKEISSNGLDELLCKWNIGRIILILGVTMLFEIANLFNTKLYFNESVVYSVILLIIGCLILSALALATYSSKTLSLSFKRHLYLIFWIVFPIILTPFYLKNIVYDEVPINLLIVIMVIATVPVINMIETSIIFIAPTIINIIILIILDVSIFQVVYIMIFLVSGFALSLSIHGKYMDLLTELSNSCAYDPLTGVLNKNAGYQRAINMYEMCKRIQQPFCIYMMDIDFFKLYNDTYGHPAGDIALKQVTECITQTFARKQDIVCRYGGEEFFICCTNKEAGDFDLLAEMLLDNIYDLRLDAGSNSTQPYVTASVGFTIFTPTDPNCIEYPSLDNLIKEADQALYKAKALGRNQYFKNV